MAPCNVGIVFARNTYVVGSVNHRESFARFFTLGGDSQ